MATRTRSRYNSVGTGSRATTDGGQREVRMRVRPWSMLTATTSVALLLAVGSSAQADIVDSAAWLDYSRIVSAEVANSASPSVSDNITCDPEAVVDGRMVTPRAPVVAGEVYAQVELAGHFKCFSLDRNMSWWVDARVTDMFWDGWTYVPGAQVSDFKSAVAGLVTVNP